MHLLSPDPAGASPLDSVAVWLGALRPRRPAAFSRATAATVSQASADEAGAGRSGGSSPGSGFRLRFGLGQLMLEDGLGQPQKGLIWNRSISTISG